MPDAIDSIGPHLLGRVPSPPDDRDWKMADYLVPAPDDALLGKTVQQVLDEGTFFSSWAGLLIFWRWLRKHLHPSPKPPSPPPMPPAPSGAVSWHDAIQLDQAVGVPDAARGHCVGFGWAAWGNCAPVEDHLTNGDGHAIYYVAKTFDGEPGAEDGSTVRSGAKAMVSRGRLGAYVFASTLQEVLDWLELHGPVVIGSDWKHQMFYPDPTGLVHTNGTVDGGHCYLLLGYDPATQLFEFDNSWGSSWGKGGRFYMTAKDFDALVIQNANGEACAGVELP